MDIDMDLHRQQQQQQIIVPAPFRVNFFDIEDLNTDNTNRTLKYCEHLVELYEETGNAAWLQKRRLTLETSLLQHDVLGVHQRQCVNSLKAALAHPVQHQAPQALHQHASLENRIEFSINQRGDFSFTLKCTRPSKAPVPQLRIQKQISSDYWQLGSLEERYGRAGIETPVIIATHWNIVAIQHAYYYLKSYKDDLVKRLVTEKRLQVAHCLREP